MALVNRLFSNCFTGGGPPIYKTFEVEDTAGWVLNQSYVIYSGDGMCYAYVSSAGGVNAKETFLTPLGTNIAGACNSSSGCPSVNSDVYPNNLYYTFSSCCDGSTVSLRRGDVELSTDWVDGQTMWLKYQGSGGNFEGCYSVITGYTGSTIYIDTIPAFAYSVTPPVPPYTNFADCADCLTYYPCAITPSPTPTITATNTMTPTPSTTPLICGSGVTTGTYYYTDCCGNFIQGNSNGLIVTLDYTKPSTGVVKLNAPALTSCLTPTPTQTPTLTPTNTITPTTTPTNTTTPTLTPTPTNTPSTSQIVKLKNECEVFTLFDMGVQCYPLKNPTSATSNDGILSLLVTGGTSPYSFYWAGGQRSQTLVGVSEGSYEVVVVDYYGDYSATTVCGIFGPSATPTSTVTPTPTLTPSPVWPSLCFYYVKNLTTSYGPIQFVPNGDLNGRPKWTATYQSVPLTLSWDSQNLRWQIQGWTFTTGIPVSTNPSNIPTSSWVMVGGPQAQLTVTQGTCLPYLPLYAEVTKQNSTCPGNKNCNGTISVSAGYGVPPYTYSIDNGVTYQASNIFATLCPNTYTVVTKDSSGSTLSTNVSIVYDNVPTNYTIGLITQGTISPASGTEVSLWQIQVTPALPVGVSIYFNLDVNVTKDYYQPGTGTITDKVSVLKNGVPQTVTSTTILPTTTYSRPHCSPYDYTEDVSTKSYSLVIGHGDVISGSSTSILSITNGVVGPNGCVTTLQQDILLGITSAIIEGGPCFTVLADTTQQGINDHNITNTNTVPSTSVSTLTGTSSCSGGQIGVFGSTSLQTLYTPTTPGFVDGAAVYTSSTLLPSTLLPENTVFRYPNSTSSDVYIISGGQMTLIGPYGSTC
jgi:hypothetical protein